MKKVLDRSNTPRTINLHEGRNRRGSKSQQHERQQSHHHILGPLTYKAHERYQNSIDATNTAPSKNSKSLVPTTSTDKKEGYSESSHPTVFEVIMAVAAVAFAVVVTIPSALLAFFLIQLLIQRLQGIWNSAVDATHIDTSVFLNGTAFSSAGEDYTSVLSATIKYAKMSLAFCTICPVLFPILAPDYRDGLYWK